mgnify:CR=1 FL=1
MPTGSTIFQDKAGIIFILNILLKLTQKKLKHLQKSKTNLMQLQRSKQSFYIVFLLFGLYFYILYNLVKSHIYM